MKTALAIVLGSMMVGQLAPFPTREHTGTQDDPFLIYNSETVSISFDDNYTADGIVLVRVEYEFVDTDGNTTHGSMDDPDGIATVDGRFKFPIRNDVLPLPDGEYRMRVRVWNRAGNASGWTAWYYAVKDWRPVPTPGGCRMSA